MAVVMSDNFAGSVGGTFAGDTKYTSTGTNTLVASTYGVGVRIPAGSIGYLDQVAFTGTTGPRVFSRIFRVSAAPAASLQIFQVRSGTGAICAASIRTSGQLGIHNGGSVASSLAVTSAAVPLGTEFRVVFTANGTSFTAAVYPDVTSTTATQTISGTITGGTMVTTREGTPTAIAGANLDIIWPVDDSAADPGLRVYVACTVSPPSGSTSATYTATGTVLNSPAGTKAWTFHWGDGATSGPQASASATHIYSAGGSYGVTVDLDVS